MQQFENSQDATNFIIKQTTNIELTAKHTRKLYFASGAYWFRPVNPSFRPCSSFLILGRLSKSSYGADLNLMHILFQACLFGGTKRSEGVRLYSFLESLCSI
ncbi:hypothetical protein Zmor_023937 [Zophobas morio]|uniref:Uncharacterized protein n=1 Tax=Zophobas morio TaxID=2755281 RepID=A0AA38I0W0_9CUCU|nr:hypothetical protein Zmor_023937 [Zophobas morio]